MALSGKTLALLAALGIGAVAVYLYLTHKASASTAPLLHPLADTSHLQIGSSFQALAADDPSVVKGDIGAAGFTTSSTENKPAAERYLGFTFTGKGGSQTRPGIL